MVSAIKTCVIVAALFSCSESALIKNSVGKTGKQNCADFLPYFKVFMFIVSKEDSKLTKVVQDECFKSCENLDASADLNSESCNVVEKSFSDFLADNQKRPKKIATGVRKIMKCLNENMITKNGKQLNGNQ